MARLNVLLTGYEITDEVIERTSSTALALGHDTIRGTADLEIWTGAAGTGTQLALTTDYTVSDEDTDLSTEAGVSIYTKLAIVNGTYHNVALYTTYKTIGDYASSGTSRLISVGYKEVTGNYTVTADDRTLVVTTASAVTITIEDGLPLGFDLLISRSVASTNAVTVAMDGSETIEGAASFVVIGAKVASEADTSEVTLRKVMSDEFRFVSGEIKGSNSNGEWNRKPNNTLDQYGTTPATTSNYQSVTLPVPFSSEYYDVIGSPKKGGAMIARLSSSFNPSNANIFHYSLIYNDSGTYAGEPVMWHAHGSWRTA